MSAEASTPLPPTPEGASFTCRARLRRRRATMTATTRVMHRRHAATRPPASAAIGGPLDELDICAPVDQTTQVPLTREAPPEQEGRCEAVILCDIVADVILASFNAVDVVIEGGGPEEEADGTRVALGIDDGDDEPVSDALSVADDERAWLGNIAFEDVELCVTVRELDRVELRVTPGLVLRADDGVHEAEGDDDDDTDCEAEAEADSLDEGEDVDSCEAVGEPLDEAVRLGVCVADTVDIGVRLPEDVFVGEMLMLSVCEGVAERVPVARCVGEAVRLWDTLPVCDTLVVCEALVDIGWLAEVDIV